MFNCLLAGDGVWSGFIAGITGAVLGFAASVLALRFHYRDLFAKTVSNNRMEWINVWRENISVFLAYAAILHRVYGASCGEGNDPQQRQDESCRAEYLKMEAEMLKARGQVTTRLNLTEEKHSLLFAAIKQVDYSAEETRFVAQCEYVEELARQILKPEWERVKNEARGKEKC